MQSENAYQDGCVEVAYFMRRLYDKGLTSCSGGNISLRLADDRVLITPSALDKGELKPEQVVTVTMDGENLSRDIKPTIEMGMHLAIFRLRPDVRAIVHAHPVYATTFSCVDREIEAELTPETIMTIGKIAKADFHPAGTGELADATASALGKNNVVLMRNHGVAAVGPTLLKAFDRLEVTELSAKMTWLAGVMGVSPTLTSEQAAATAALFS